MRAECFPCDKGPQDIRGPFSNSIHFRIANELFDAEGRLATHPFRLRSLIPHPTENDLCVFQKSNRFFRTEYLCHSGLDTDVVPCMIGEMPYKLRQRFHCKEIRRPCARSAFAASGARPEAF